MLKKMFATILPFVWTLTAFTAAAQPHEWSPEQFRGEWEMQLFFDIDPSGGIPSERPHYEYYGTVVFSFRDDGTALLAGQEAEAITVTWQANDYLLTIGYPDDGDFQYTETYQFVAVDEETLFIVRYSIFDGPTTGMMKRLTIPN